MNRPVQPLVYKPEEAECLIAEVKRRDWEQIIRALLAAGLAQRAIAAQVGVSQGTLQHYMNDPRAEPKDSVARKIMVLYRRVSST